MAEHDEDPRRGAPVPRSGEDADLNDAMVFLNRIKDEYADSLPVYDSFLEMMRDFKFGKIDADEVCKAVRLLFKEKPFLIRHFDEYLPQYLRYGDPRSCESPRCFPRPPFRPHSSSAYASVPSTSRCSSAAARDSTLLPSSAACSNISGVQNPTNTPKHRLAEDFIHLVKKRYSSSPATYKQFVELLQRPRNSFSRLLAEVSALFADSPDLIELFERNFRPGAHDSSATSSTSTSGHGPSSVHSGPSSGLSSYAVPDPLKAVKDALASQNLLDDFLKILNFYNQNIVCARDLVFLVSPLVRDPESLAAFKAFLRYEEQEPFRSSSSGSNNQNHLMAPGTATKGVSGGAARDSGDTGRIGSYRLFPMMSSESISSTLAAGSGCLPYSDVLNRLCLSVATYESEEDTFVFRSKNSSEDLLVRVADERSEADLQLGRLRFLISELEGVAARMAPTQRSSSSAGNGGSGDSSPDTARHKRAPEVLDLDDVRMSPALVKETLKQVYESKGAEVLEVLLSSPERALPVVLRRLQAVYRENLAAHRSHRRAWRALCAEHYYKAYDTLGVSFRSSERKSLTFRQIFLSSKEPLVVDIGESRDSFAIVRNLFRLFIESAASNGAGGRRSGATSGFGVADQREKFDELFSKLVSFSDENREGVELAPAGNHQSHSKERGDQGQLQGGNRLDFVVKTTFDEYALARYICTLAIRFAELKYQCPKEPLCSSKTAVKLGLQSEFCIVDRYAALIDSAESLASRKIDAEEFESRARFLTDACGYKLYNLRRVLSKMERLVTLLLGKRSGGARERAGDRSSVANNGSNERENDEMGEPLFEVYHKDSPKSRAGCRSSAVIITC